MISTLLELAGFAAITAAATVLGVALGDTAGGLIGGLLVAGVFLVILGLAFGGPARLKR